jgi:uncharacterized membrane protein YqiK
MNSLALPGTIAGCALIVLFAILRLLYKVAEPNEALIISGLGVRVKRLGFKIITGKGVLVMPGFQTGTPGP